MPEISDIQLSIQVKDKLVYDPVARNADFHKLPTGGYERYSGGFSVVFPCEYQGEKWAFRCWHVTIDKAMERYKLLSTALPTYKLPYFIDFYYEDLGIVVCGTPYPTIRMRWIKGRNIKDYIGHNLNDSQKIYKLASEFLEMVRALHGSSIAHGDLQHENIMVNSRGKLVLIDYDSLFIPELKGVADDDTIAGKPDYQHPCRKKNKTASPKIDYFSEVVILLGILGIAKDRILWERYHVAGSDGLLFSKEDFANLKKSRIYLDLYRFGHPFSDLLDVLTSYLGCQDINRLEPFESYGIFSDGTLDLLKYIEEQSGLEKEDTLWKEVSANNTIYSYSKYLSAFPNGRYVKFAKQKIADIEETRNKIAEAIARDDEAWKNACSEDTIESYMKYLHNFPTGAYKVVAKDKIDEIKWKIAVKADTADAYNVYLKNYPYGRFASIARRSVKQIEAEAKCWYKAVTVNTVDSYNAYLKKYPIGKHMDEAKKRLGQLEVRIKRRKRAGRVVAAVFCAGMLILSVSVGPSAVRYVSRYVQTEFVKGKSPAKAGQQQNVSALEKETQEKIDRLKSGKRKGWTENADYKRQVEDNLERLNQLGSARYNELRKEYESL